ncbi:Hsp20/alpha crystallin family protein [Ancylostoma caninum]|uniref:Hsp20/alpha crystallin family protein n=1 Tax=Ancylostoma caninum TaxID=29170 RepID=A0A368FMH7_ANCCA|nr:Hsp20/alpha crystallin family protein [Ancylostoma caninum]
MNISYKNYPLNKVFLHFVLSAVVPYIQSRLSASLDNLVIRRCLAKIAAIYEAMCILHYLNFLRVGGHSTLVESYLSLRNWNNSLPTVEVEEVVSGEKEIGIKPDVPHFKPEELQVHLEGLDLTTKGKYGNTEKSEHGFIKRSFVRKWALPEYCDVGAVQAQLNDFGYLCIEAPKSGQHTHGRTPPITPASKKK